MLKEKDKIFKNLYGFQDWSLEGAKFRGVWDGTKDLLARGSNSIIDELIRKSLGSVENFGYIGVSSTYGSTADTNVLINNTLYLNYS